LAVAAVQESTLAVAEVEKLSTSKVRLFLLELIQLHLVMAVLVSQVETMAGLITVTDRQLQLLAKQLKVAVAERTLTTTVLVEQFLLELHQITELTLV
jgi:hypothetical protein